MTSDTLVPLAQALTVLIAVALVVLHVLIAKGHGRHVAGELPRHMGMRHTGTHRRATRVDRIMAPVVALFEPLPLS